MQKHSLSLKLSALLLALSLGCGQSAHSDLLPSVPTLTLDFEDGVAGVGRDGQTVVPRVEGKAELQDGKFGKAFKSGPGAGYLHFPTKDIVSTQAGTVEMWVMPIDWSGDEKAFHMFFAAKSVDSGDADGDADKKGKLYLYKYLSSGLGLLFLSHDGGKTHNRLANKNIDSWKPGEWHHIAATWWPSRQELYIDGKVAGSGLPSLPKSLAAEFLIGDSPFEPSIPRTSQSLIDGVRVYDRVLSPEVIAAHAAGDYGKATPLSEESARLNFAVADKRVRPTLTLTGADVDTRAARADFSILQGERVVATQTNRPFDGVIAAGDFADEFAPGEYTLRVALHDSNGTSVGTLEQPMTVPSREWLNNTLGEEKKVLAPWTPLEVKRGTTGFAVQCWGREYRFGDGLLPLQIVAKGEPLLQSPMALDVRAGGQKLNWKPQRAQIKNASDYEVNVTSVATAATPQGELRVESEFHLEYDGLAVLKLKFQAPAGFKPDAVTLDIPVRAQNALYRHGWDANMKAFSGSLPAGQGVVQNSAFLPAAWLGDNERGLFWFCESAQFWPNWKSENAFQIRRENGTATMRLNLTDNQTLPANWNFEFGLQATPVKPLPKDWRKWRLTPAPRATNTILWPNKAPDTNQYFGYAQARNDAAFQKRVESERARGLEITPYSLLNGLSGATPEWKWFGDTWGIGDGDYGSADVVKVGAPLEYVSPTQETWRDFVIWKNKQFMDKHGIKGFYHDLTWPFASATPSANTGWFDGEQWQKTHPLLAYRELYRRNYAVVKAAQPDSFLMGHMSSRITIPMVAYEDAYLTGETLITPLKGKESYMDVLSLDQWRTEYTGRQWGVIPFILPEFDAVQREKVQPTRGLAALTLLHDTSVWAIWSNQKVWAEMYNDLDAFGYIESTFIPYWAATPPATTTMKDVYISVYKRADGRALAVVGNTSKEARSGTVTLNPKSIGLDSSQVMSWPDKEALVSKDGKIELSVPALDYRLLLIGKAP